MNPAFLTLRRYRFVHMRGSDKIRIAVNGAFYTHLSVTERDYTQMNLQLVLAYISHTGPQ